MTICLKRIKIV